MKLFQLIQTNWLILGISSNHHPFDQKLAMGLVLYSLAIILSIFFALLDANDFMECTNAAYQTAALALCAICILNIAFRMELFFNFIENCEILVANSE